MKFQSTHPCGVRLRFLPLIYEIDEVSIHAPLRGATDGFFALIHALSVSIHAPLRGATCLNERCNPAPQFQSTHPCGVRLCPGHIPHPQKAVSIHAPLRGATNGSSGSNSPPRCFNPRTPAGCDPVAAALGIEIEVSIHAPLRGATWLRIRAQVLHEVSIHAPLRGATAPVWR